jgi:hypothetical protein
MKATNSKNNAANPEPQTADSQPAAGTAQRTKDFFTPEPGESARAFQAFCTYIEFGPQRRYAAVARKMRVSLVSIKRWAARFDWRTRLSTQAAARAAEQFAQDRDAEELESADRDRSFRERQLLLAEAILDVAERYFERMDDTDLEHMRFPDACRALEFASRLVGQSQGSDAPAAPDHALRDQLEALLDQAYPDTSRDTNKVSSATA